VQIADPVTKKAIGTVAAKKLIDDYINTAYPCIQQWWDWLSAYAKSNGHVVRTVHGRVRKLPGLALNKENRHEKWAYLADERRMKNTPIQGSAADLVIMAMLRCNPEPHPDLIELGYVNWTLHELGVSMLAQVHDELVFMVPEENAEAALAEITTSMENALPLRIPTPVEAHIADNWGDAK
jgi:DNA polymerase-1